MGGAALRLYELVLANGRSASPYVWRIRYALAHKGLAWETVPVGFTEIPGIHAGRFKTVPVLEHAGTAIGESWDIAEYLEREFPERPLFSGAAERALVRFFDAWIMSEVVRRMVGIYVRDVHDAARPADRAYFRKSREERLKAPLESVAAGREARLPALREALAPMRAQLARYPFVGGTAPNYADYIALATFQWIGSVATLPPLARDDAILRNWLERGAGLYGGFGAELTTLPLFD